MKTAMPINVPSLTHPRLWAKARALLAVIPMSIITLGYLASPPASSEPQAELIGTATLFAMWALALWAVLGIRARTMFSELGIVDVRELREISLPWELLTKCTVVEKTLRSARGPCVPGVLVRFEGRQRDLNHSMAKSQARDRIIELFVPDAVPLAPDIVALLRTVPQTSRARWDLLDPSRRQQDSDSGRDFQ